MSSFFEDISRTGPTLYCRLAEVPDELQKVVFSSISDSSLRAKDESLNSNDISCIDGVGNRFRPRYRPRS